jgi:hypothetical protein
VEAMAIVFIKYLLDNPMSAHGFIGRLGRNFNSSNLDGECLSLEKLCNFRVGGGYMI